MPHASTGNLQRLSTETPAKTLTHSRSDTELTQPTRTDNGQGDQLPEKTVNGSEPEVIDLEVWEVTVLAVVSVSEAVVGLYV